MRAQIISKLLKRPQDDPKQAAFAKVLKQHAQLAAQLDSSKVRFGNDMRPAFEDANAAPEGEMLCIL